MPSQKKVSKEHLFYKLASAKIFLSEFLPYCFQVSKGQLILKCPFGVFKSPKKTNDFFQDFCPIL